MTATPRPPHRITRLAHALRARFPRAGAALFWGWNLVFLAFMTFGFAPNLLPELVEASRSGDIATGFLLHAMVLTVIPALAVGVALTRLARAPERLFAFGYGIEGPLMLLVGVRLFVIRELTPAAAAMLAIAGLGLAAYLWVLLDRMPMDARGSLAAGVRVVGLSLLVLVGLYAAAWITFYAVPLAVQAVAFVRHDILGNLSQALADLWRSIRDFDWRSLAAWRELPLIVFGSILFALTAALFVAMPVVIATLYARAWAAAMRVAGAHLGRRTAGALAAGTVAAAVALVAAADRQPQAAAFAALATPPADAAAARALTGREAELRAGLLNAYLARYRYFSAVGELRHLRDLYTNTAVDLTAARAARVQRAYEALVRPLLYRSVVAAERRTAPGTRTPQGLAFTADAARAAELYQRYFDRPIDEAERPAIVAAVRATWMVDQAEAARLAVDDREVHLERQDVRVTEHGDWAELELHEVYRNRTTRRQEVVYHFTLPESAVVTGVWLGTSDDRDQRFAFRVAPRGAAQQVYREEVRRRVDPALVEQIGPRQYRLRVFPVEPREWGFGEDGRRMRAIDGPPLHLWLTWRVLAADGAWPLPRLGELRNVYWDASTARTVAGAAVAGADPAWLPAAVPAQSPITPAPHRVDFPDGRTVLAQPAADIDAAALAPGTRVAVVVDRSRSMADRAPDVAAALGDLRARVAAGALAVDVYLTASDFRGEPPAVAAIDAVDAAAILYFGGQHPAELLAQAARLRGPRAYAAILVLTDGSRFSAPPTGIDVDTPAEPVWMVHLGGDFPPGYDDATLEAIQASGGGVAASVGEALARLAAGAAAPVGEAPAATASGEPGTLPPAGGAAPGSGDPAKPAVAATADLGRSDVVDGYRWSVVRTADLAPAGGGTAVAAAGFALAAAGRADVRGAGTAPPASADTTLSASASPSVPLSPDPAFAPLAARRVILGELQAARGDVERLPSLDRLHALAAGHGIVTPYSSMIVLVNAAQQKRLDDLEQAGDRFAREVEATSEMPDPFAATAVPEPEEWLLVALAAALLIGYAWRRPAAA